MKQGIKSPKGNVNWSDSTIRGILRNEKYKGDVLHGKTYTEDPISHRGYDVREPVEVRIMEDRIHMEEQIKELTCY